MTELEQVIGKHVSRETVDLLDRFSVLLRKEAEVQNLISRSTVDGLWNRHILDSAQLLRFQTEHEASWVDIGSGAGLPGVVIAALSQGPVLLTEPRRLRAEFLSRVVAELGLGERVKVLCAKAERAQGRFDTITARAVASLDKLLGITLHLSHPDTVWILPKGRSAKSELEEAWRNWHCDARVEGSMTDPDAAILVVRNVRAKGKA